MRMTRIMRMRNNKFIEVNKLQENNHEKMKNDNKNNNINTSNDKKKKIKSNNK